MSAASVGTDSHCPRWCSGPTWSFAQNSASSSMAMHAPVPNPARTRPGHHDEATPSSSILSFSYRFDVVLHPHPRQPRYLSSHLFLRLLPDFWKHSHVLYWTKHYREYLYHSNCTTYLQGSPTWYSPVCQYFSSPAFLLTSSAPNWEASSSIYPWSCSSPRRRRDWFLQLSALVSPFLSLLTPIVFDLSWLSSRTFACGMPAGDTTDLSLFDFVWFSSKVIIESIGDWALLLALPSDASADANSIDCCQRRSALTSAYSPVQNLSSRSHWEVAASLILLVCWIKKATNWNH